MLDSADGEGIRVDTAAVREANGAFAAAGPASPAKQVLLDWLEAPIALLSLMDLGGTAGWKYRSVYEFVAAHGRWLTPAVLPAQVRALPERQCFARRVPWRHRMR